MEDYINESKLDFIVNTPDKEVYILADGKKTFRVFENLNCQFKSDKLLMNH